MIDISNVNLDEIEYETKFERGVLVYYVNGLRIDKYDLIVAAAMSEEKTHSLNDGHQREDHTYRTGGRSVIEHTHKEGIGHVVKRSDQHTDDARKCQLADQFWHRRLSHPLKFQFLFVHCMLLDAQPRGITALLTAPFLVSRRIMQLRFLCCSMGSPASRSFGSKW